MDYAVVLSRADQGLDAPPVRVEVHLSNGLPAFAVVGMARTAVRESKDRVRSALLNSHFVFPDRRITVNLAPADLPKEGGRYDLPIALGILCASGQLPAAHLKGIECLGELALDGSLREVVGGIAATVAAGRTGHRVILPPATARRAAALDAAPVLSAPDLLSLCAVLRGAADGNVAPARHEATRTAAPDLAEVIGQGSARRALEVAAAGGHNLLLAGPPGCGKSLLASCLPGILPPAEAGERVDILALHDLGGQDAGPGRPFRAPHHSASATALVGGGSIPKPGEISLAHGGVLFLDELPEFGRHALDMLREPLETGTITLARARCRITYPARFQLVAAMNPCPCGYAGDPRRACRCTPARIDSYAARVSGPLLDRIDLQLHLQRGETRGLLDAQARGESSAAVLRRVCAARELQKRRQGIANARLDGTALKAHCALDAPGRQLLQDAVERMQLSARALHRCLRVARTIADLAAADRVGSEALAEALTYRLEGEAAGATSGAGKAVG
jgi:magnesium chelatase family protein